MELAQAAETCLGTGALSWRNLQSSVGDGSVNPAVWMGLHFLPTLKVLWTKGMLDWVWLSKCTNLLFTGASSCSVPNILQTSLRTVLCDTQKKRSQLARSRNFFKKTCEHSHFFPIASIFEWDSCTNKGEFLYFSFGLCPHMTEDNKELIQGKDLLVAYYDIDYEKNPKGSNYWRNR